MTIWKVKPDLAAVRQMQERTMVSTLGIEFTEIGDDYVRGTMPVDSRTHQPMGILHGGASVALAESLGSMAANLCVDTAHQYCVGLDINANHIRGIRGGIVTGTARPAHLGRTTQVWEIRIEDGAGRLVCLSRLTMAVLDR
ncbi:MAG: hotdog fold thioesterase [Pseudomonadota bacterium]